MGIAFALLAALLIAAIMLSGNQRRAEGWVRHTLEVETGIARVLYRLQDAESAERGYIITGDQRFLAAYRAARNVEGDLDSLSQATADNPRQQQAIARLRPLVQNRLEQLGIGIQLRSTKGFAAAADWMRGGQSQTVVDGARREIGVMVREEQRLLATREARVDANRRSLELVLFAGFAGLALLTVFALQEANRRYAALGANRDDLARANARLVAAAEARNQAEARLRQVQKMESIGQLTGGIAHDFNNMLSIIIGSLELARRRVSSDVERAILSIDNAMEGAERAANLTARLLAFSRQQPLAPAPIDPNKLVSGMSELLRRTIGEQVKVETVLAGGVWRVNVDSQQLENAILNLCVNARDAMPDGGRLTIETANAFLDETYAASHSEVAPGQYVLISATDTGLGMAPEVIERAFDPFYTTKGTGHGTGLGLSQVFGFVKQSGGHVKIYSEVGQGTSVKIYLPRWTGEVAAPRPQTQASAAPRAKDHETILVVEDEEQVRNVTVDALRDLGYTVVHAASGEQALEQLRLQPHVDLLLTDIIMPGMTGQGLASAARAERPHLPVLYMTGYTRNAVVHNGVLDSGVAFLQKPFTGEQLARKIRAVLDGEGANRPL